MIANFSLFAAFTALFIAISAQASPTDFSHSGYTDSVPQEMAAEVATLAIPSDPVTRQDEIPIVDVIFDDRLKSEFRGRYREQFGLTDAEVSLRIPSRYNYYFGSTTSSSGQFDPGSFRGDEIEKYEASKSFGNYMFKRLSEYHFDRFLRERPVVKKVYEVKEKLSKVKLQISEDVKLRVRYEFSGNLLRVNFENPWLDHSLLVEMDPSKVGPSEAKEVIFTMNVPFDSDIALETFVRFLEGSVTLVGRKQLTPILAATLTGKVDSRLDHGDPESDREDLMLGGLSWNY